MGCPLGAYELFGKTALNIPGTPLRNSPYWALQGHYFVCGRKAYKVLQANWTGSCYIAHGVPHISITATLPKGKIRNAQDTSVKSREKTLWRLTTALEGNMKNSLTTEKLVGCSVLGIAPLFTGPAMACIGRYTVRLQMVLEKVALELEDSVSDLGSAVKTLNKEIQRLRTFFLQNRLALDYFLASQGGVCALIGPRCCVYVNDSSYEICEKVVQAEAHARAQVAYTAPESDWLQTLFSGWGLSFWLGGLFSLLLKLLFPVLLVLLVLCCAVSCVRALLQKLISHSLQDYHKVLMQSPIVKK
ncbi:syncytin-A-like [Caretta caretta]|uniref:syncytin-A-like n=1 Tax=Caretta caretta TaxID=8467 RepID=UPI003F4B4487